MASDTALAHAQRAARQLAAGAHGAAFESLASALRLAPEMPALWAQFSDLIRYFNLRHPIPPQVRDLLARALEHPAVDPGNLVRPVTTLALLRVPGQLRPDVPVLGYLTASASSAARSRARALCWVSIHSERGSESATMPAAACTCSLRSLTTAVRMAMATSMSPLKPR